MASTSKNQIWNNNAEIDKEPVPNVEGIQKQILAYCDSCMCVQNDFETGAVGPLHAHPHTQITYVAEGTFSFTIGEETRTVTKGDVLLKQDGVLHGCTCIEKGSLIDFFTPMREDFV